MLHDMLYRVKKCSSDSAYNIYNLAHSIWLIGLKTMRLGQFIKCLRFQMYHVQQRCFDLDRKSTVASSYGSIQHERKTVCVSHSNAGLQVCCNNAVYQDASEKHMVQLQSKKKKNN